jgi:hypothetical protein
MESEAGADLAQMGECGRDRAAGAGFYREQSLNKLRNNVTGIYPF